MWIVGFRTPQNASFKKWFALVSAVVILGLIIFVVLLLVNNLLRDKDARKRFVEGSKQREFGFRGKVLSNQRLILEYDVKKTVFLSLL
jgi:L-asparagine transporter-like permease